MTSKVGQDDVVYGSEAKSVSEVRYDGLASTSLGTAYFGHWPCSPYMAFNLLSPSLLSACCYRSVLPALLGWREFSVGQTATGWAPT